MATIKSYSELVNSMLERLRLVQPNLDTKPGSVARDLFVDLQADELQKIYKLIALIADKQSFATASGKDLDRLAQNFGIIRNSGTPSSGIVIFTASDIDQDLEIPSGTVVSARNGVSYNVLGNFAMLLAEKNKYAANATRLSEVLNVAGISDKFAIEIPVEATTVGSTGNVSSFQIVTSDARFSFQVTNSNSMSGGTDTESDAAFKTRFLALFSGSNTGTSLGYRNALLGIQGVLDALIVEPGNTLMLRDGTEVISNDKTTRILSSGTGGKVDAYVLGTILDTLNESYIFRNKSFTGDITDDVNDHILGVFNQDTSLTSEERRYIAFRDGNLPFQPVDQVISLVGSSSGILSQAVLNDDGSYTGNYILVKDTNADTGGSPFGFDKIKFISNKKNVNGEPIVKTSNNIIDNLTFTNIESIDEVYQDLIINQENSLVSATDASKITIKLTPVVKVSSVLNSTTGEIYKITDSGLDSDLGFNPSGVITISGKNLPTLSDKLKVSYVWRKFFDENINYASKRNTYYKEPTKDAVDWSVSNGVPQEVTLLNRDAETGAFSLDVSKKISAVQSVFFLDDTTGVVSLINERLAVDLSSYSSSITNVITVKNSGGVEYFDTISSDGSLNNKVIFLPTDSGAVVGDDVSVQINKIELYDLDKNDGTFNAKTIELPEVRVLESLGLFEIVNNGYFTEREAYVNYSADQIPVIPSINMSSLPVLESEDSNFLIDKNFSEISQSFQPVEFDFLNNVIQKTSKYSPTSLNISTSGIASQGKVLVEGLSAERHIIQVFAGNAYDGSSINIKNEVKQIFGSSFSESIFISKVNKISLDDVEISLNGYGLSDNTYDMLYSKSNPDLTNFQIEKNITGYTSGSIIEIDVYLSNPNAQEELYYYKSGSRFTNLTYYRINKVNIISGFKNNNNLVVGSISINQFNQPISNSTYFSDYQFKAPRDGERLAIQYNVNNLIRQATQGVEAVRPVTADILIKEAAEILVDVSGEIVVDEDFESDKDSVVENVNNAISNLLNLGTLGGLIDYSDVIQVATGVSGVDSVNVASFNISGETGRRSFVKALDNQTISPGLVSFKSVSRKNFRIS